MVRVCANNLITHARPANQAVIIYVREMYIKNVNGILNLSLKYHANCFVAKMTYLNTALKQFKINDSHHRWSLAGKGAGDKAYNLNAKNKHNVCLIADTFSVKWGPDSAKHLRHARLAHGNFRGTGTTLK